MQNRISSSVSGILTQAGLAIPGVNQYAVALALTRVTEAGMTTKMGNVTVAMNLHEAGKLELSDRRDVLGLLGKNGYQFLVTSRDVIKPFLGTQHSAEWDSAGFVGSLSVRRSVAAVLKALRLLNGYLTLRPEQENAALNVTAARALTFVNDILAAQAAVNAQKAAVRLLKVTRDDSADLLRVDVQRLLAELKLSLDGLDGRWEAFGFKRPAAQHIPDVPEDVEVLLVGGNAASVKWGAAARAGHYRVWKKVVGVDEEMIPVGSVTDLDFTIEGLPGNGTVEIAISAVNNGGESAKSAVVSFQMA